MQYLSIPLPFGHELTERFWASSKYKGDKYLHIKRGHLPGSKHFTAGDHFGDP